MQAHTTRARLAAAAEKDEEAIRSLSRAIMLQPTNPALYRARGRLLLRDGALDLAMHDHFILQVGVRAARPRPSACADAVGLLRSAALYQSGAGTHAVASAAARFRAERCARKGVAERLVQSLQPDMNVEQLVQQTRALVAAQHVPLALKLLERHKKVRRGAAQLGFKAVPSVVCFNHEVWPWPHARQAVRHAPCCR